MNKQDHHVFPAVFSREDQYVCVRFPDLPGCNTFGDSYDNALYMAEDALGGHLLSMIDNNYLIPEPTPFEALRLKEGEVVVMIEVWLSVLREEENNKAVKKTITIPNWLNKKAQKAHVNFSSVMQEALRERLGA